MTARWTDEEMKEFDISIEASNRSRAEAKANAPFDKNGNYKGDTRPGIGWSKDNPGKTPWWMD